MKIMKFLAYCYLLILRFQFSVALMFVYVYDFHPVINISNTH